MKKVYLLLLFVFGFSTYAQQKGISYQAVITNPNEIKAPGYNATAIPLANKGICMSFKIVNSANQVEYQESQAIMTDAYGMINVVIGTGRTGSGLVSTLEAVTWNQGNKKLKVGVNIDGSCSNYTEISNQILNYTPYSFYALNADLKDGSVTDAKVASGINPSKVGLGNVNNTSDVNKPISTATQTALNLKEDVSNKSTAIGLGNSDLLYPTQKAVKAYVDAQTASASIVDADATTKGKIQLTGDLGGTAGAPTVPGLTLKENAANKSTLVALGTSNILFPTQNAVKTYVDTAISTASIADADSTTKGKIKLGGDLAGTADAPTIAAGAVTNVKITNGAVTDAKITNVSASKVTGTVAIANGGTGAATAAGARTNLGLVIGTDVLAQRTFGTAANSAATDFVAVNEKAANNGVATLGNDGKIPSSQIPAISFQSVNVVNSQADMISNSSAQVGSITIRTDINRNFVLSNLPASTLSNWIELSTPTSVTSVNGYAGPNVSLTKADVGLGNIDNTTDAGKPVSTATLSALALKENSANKSTATDLGSTNPSDVLFPSQKAVKTYVDLQSANAGVADNSITSAKINGTITIAKGGTNATNAADARTNLGLAIGTDVMAANATTTLTGDVTGSGNGSFTTSLANSGVTAGTYGSSTAIPTLTIDSKGRITSANAVGIIAGVNSINYTSTTSYAEGGTINGTSLTLSSADGTNPGLISTSAQTFAGAKTFTSDIKVNGLTIGMGASAISSSTAVGYEALNANTIGIENTAVGYRALKSNTTGSSNLAFGNNSLKANTTGSNNTAIGNSIMTNSTTGGANTAVGSGALQSNTNNNNTAIGYASLLNNNAGNGNTAVGVSALQNNISGTNNTALGYSALQGATGTYNTAVGNGARVLDGTTTTNATAIGNGAYALSSNTIQLGNTSVTSVKTSGTVTAGTVTYPNTHNSVAGQVLITDASGVASWASTRSWTDQPATVSANQTAFTLTYAPPTTVKVWMFINGVRTNNNAYTVSGTTVTYTPANNGGYTITSSDRIQFDYTY